MWSRRKDTRKPSESDSRRVRIHLNKSSVLDVSSGPKRRGMDTKSDCFCGVANPLRCCIFLLIGNVLLTALSTRILIGELNESECHCDDDSDGEEQPTWTTYQPVVTDFSQLQHREMDQALHWLGNHGKSNQMVKAPLFMGNDINKTKSLPPQMNFSTRYWQFNKQISSYALYDATTTDNYKLVDDIIHDLANEPIVSMMSEPEAGTELKFWVDLPNGLRSIIKPMRLKRQEELDPNLFYFSEKERHYAEIAAYHLDRILGFNHVPPCVGRVISIRNELMHLADDQLLGTLHYAPDGKLCFYGQCDYFCDVRHPICGDPDEVEFAFCLIIPNLVWKHRNIVSPWRRSYMKQRLANWLLAEFNDTYCEKSVLNDEKYNKGRRLLDLVDLYIFDFFTGNQDRHSYNIFKDIGESGLISYDNGRGFGRSYRDDLTILAPLYHCCTLRKSTYDKLKFLWLWIAVFEWSSMSLSKTV